MVPGDVVPTSPPAATPSATADRPARAPAPAPEVWLPVRVRVGLDTDHPSYALPCCQDEYLIYIEGERTGFRIRAGSPQVVIRPAARSVTTGVFRLQAAALKDERQAVGLARRLGGLLDQPADAVFDAGTDLYRVRVGAYRDRAEAERAARQLEAAGVSGAWIAQEGGTLEGAGFTLEQGGKSRRVDGRSLVVSSPSGVVAFEKRTFRGALGLFLNGRGSLNIVNHVSLDDYLRGVLPMEMGPALFPEPEALAAQTIAARTYVVRHMGEFQAEGYDICATPRCQVYGGMGAEHPMSDRAVATTSGQILVADGGAANAMYSATCGGHTEDVSAVFPQQDEWYLEGIACWERGVDEVRGYRTNGAFERELLDRLLGPVRRKSSLDARLEQVAARIDVPSPPPMPVSRARSEIALAIRQNFDLRLEPGLLQGAHNEELSPAGRALTRFFGRRGRNLTAPEEDELVLLLMREFGLLRRVRGGFLTRSGDRLRVRVERSRLDLVVGPDLLLAPERGVQRAGQGTLSLRPGDPLEIYYDASGARAIIPRFALAHRAGPRIPGPWRKFRSDRELARLVEARYPGFQMIDLEVLRTGRSGRVAEVLLRDATGRELTIEGLAIRWTFDLPDVRFTVSRETSGRRGWLFRGQGHGHGVGLCQRGAVGMAARGHDRATILEHYYGGLRPMQVTQATGG